MKQLITGHNKKIISTSEGRVGSEDQNCKCIGVDRCQLGGQCRVESIVYQAEGDVLGSILILLIRRDRAKNQYQFIGILLSVQNKEGGEIGFVNCVFQRRRTSSDQIQV